MANTFNMLRANDLIWSFVVNNYLLGKEPFPFDLLYWEFRFHAHAGGDAFLLSAPDVSGRTVCRAARSSCSATKIDLTKIDLPVFILSTREDHIAPWKSTYLATQLYTGPTKFCLAASGHIAGVVNPPASGKYGHWVNDRLPKKAEQWLETATQRQGSWWPTWDEWVKSYAGEQIPARKPGDGGLKVLGPAPGTYVKVKAQ